MTVEQAIGQPRDQFPIGMRVLAVDDDPTCLKLLENLLRRCNYHVTTTGQAITALKLLRENKNKFDLVISDVHMPDMDGFKLLELVGLEMDLPVIMLSGNGDTKLVMKGITHGACDYLLKPVRIEELKNIWQHVIRRRKIDPKDQNGFDNQDKPHNESGETAGMGNPSQTGLLNKKRKDQIEDDDEVRDENGYDNGDPSTQKKPRVVWSIDLHGKFVAAVNHLGIDKAVPKKILDLMNVENLSRENVASHLQKYRLFLKRISCAANQQANMAVALGSADPSYLRMNSLNGLGNFPALSGSGQFQTAAFRSFPHSGMLGRLNSPAAMGMRSVPSSGTIQLGHAQSSGYTTNDQAKFQSIPVSGNNNGNILHGMPMSLQLDQLRSKDGVISTGELSAAIDSSTVFSVSNGFSDAKTAIGCSNTPPLRVTNNALMLGTVQEAQGVNKFVNQSSGSLNSGQPSHLPDYSRINGDWSSAVTSSGIQPNSLALSDCFGQATLRPSNLVDGVSMMALHVGNNSSHLSSTSSVHNHLQDSKLGVQCQAAPSSSIGGRVSNNAPQVWDDLEFDTSLSAPINGIVDPLGQSLGPNDVIFHRNMDFNSIGQTNFVERSAVGASLNWKDGYLMGQPKSQGIFTSNSVGSLEDLVTAMVKQEQDTVNLMEDNCGYNSRSLRTCI